MLQARARVLVITAGLVMVAMGSVIGTQMAHAEQYDGVEFPAGAVSFADAVTAYAPVINGDSPSEPNRQSASALGVPTCGNGSATGCFVSLGNGGIITLQFVDNRLQGDGTGAKDLWIFESGPAVEDTFVQVSVDGTTFTDVGKVLGATAGVDLDAFGIGPGANLQYVRLRDDPAENTAGGSTAGADIDAVGAISSAPPQSSSTSSTVAGSGSSSSTAPSSTSSTSSTVAVSGSSSSTAPSSTVVASSSTVAAAAGSATTTTTRQSLPRMGSTTDLLTLLGLGLVGVGLISLAQATYADLRRGSRAG